MTNPKHDYAATLAEFNRAEWDHDFLRISNEGLRTIRHALKVTERLMQEPSDGMMEVYKKAFTSEQRFDGAEVFKAMRDQLLREVESD